MLSKRLREEIKEYSFGILEKAKPIYINQDGRGIICTCFNSFSKPAWSTLDKR